LRLDQTFEPECAWSCDPCVDGQRRAGRRQAFAAAVGVLPRRQGPAVQALCADLRRPPPAARQGRRAARRLPRKQVRPLPPLRFLSPQFTTRPAFPPGSPKLFSSPPASSSHTLSRYPLSLTSFSPRSNPFDVVGARAFGMNAIWVDRAGAGWTDRLGTSLGGAGAAGAGGGTSRTTDLTPTTIVRGLGDIVDFTRSLRGDA
jgi:hypothetical protein